MFFNHTQSVAKYELYTIYENCKNVCFFKSKNKFTHVKILLLYSLSMYSLAKPKSYSAIMVVSSIHFLGTQEIFPMPS